MSEKHLTAHTYASQAHASIDQKRKYTGDAYIVHPERVMLILLQAGVTELPIIQAALLHDVIEDVFPKNPQYSLADIREKFGWEVEFMVNDLTDRFTSEAFPELNRATRKQLEAERISRIGDGALKIKLADLIDNTNDIVKHDPGFAYSVYLPEKRRILGLVGARIKDSKDEVLKSLFQQASNQINQHEVHS